MNQSRAEHKSTLVHLKYNIYVLQKHHHDQNKNDNKRKT